MQEYKNANTMSENGEHLKRMCGMMITDVMNGGDAGMEETKDSLYAAFKAKDTRFDGRFFVGISSTGIYCRPVCRAKQAKKENCTFFSSAAEAEAAGFRPCLLCRPELAPGGSQMDAASALAHRAAVLLEENCGSGQSLSELAGRLGCTDRHLRRVFMEAYHVSPVQYLQTCRLLLAKSLLTDTGLSVLDVAMAAGFGSLRRLNDLFQEHYGLAPTALRKKTAEGKGHTETITAGLGYRPPYGWKKILEFLSQRAIPGVEAVRDGAYERTVCLTDRKGRTVRGWISVGNDGEKNRLVVTLGDTLITVMPQVLARIRRMFDLCCNPDAIGETLQAMDEIAPGLWVPGTRIPGCFDSFEMSVRAVLGQQITVKAAGTLAGKIAGTYGKPIETGIPGLTHTFPSAGDIVALSGPIEEHLGVLGVIAARSRCILAIAQALTDGKISLDFCADPETEMKKLLGIKGIGNWTARYIAMRTFGWTDAFLETDVGIKKALPDRTEKEIRELSERWSPWRSYATISLWNSL